jgi:hypothetical protein
MSTDYIYNFGWKKTLHYPVVRERWTKKIDGPKNRLKFCLFTNRYRYRLIGATKVLSETILKFRHLEYRRSG